VNSRSAISRSSRALVAGGRPRIAPVAFVMP
jgi:hypothetical protein